MFTQPAYALMDFAGTTEVYTPVVEEGRGVGVSLRHQQLCYFVDGVALRCGKISSGRDGFETPPGMFHILEKEVFRRSSIYDNAAMPYSMRYWGNYYIHGGKVPGHRDSHGCVRVKRKMAGWLFERLEVGDKVVIAA